MRSSRRFEVSSSNLSAASDFRAISFFRFAEEDPPDGCSSSINIWLRARAAFSAASFSECFFSDSERQFSTICLSLSDKSSSLEKRLSSDKREIASSQSSEGFIEDSFFSISDFFFALRFSSRDFLIFCARSHTELFITASESGSNCAHMESILSSSFALRAASSGAIRL